MLTDASARALYLFPTKALTQDQLRGLRGLLPPKLAARVSIFDGDTPTGERSAVRRSAQAVFTNPDMLQVGMLPHHRAWARLWQSLRYVVIDEMHVYRGVFGSHVANVIRRLRRLCAHYGSDPVFILCSATIANPGELAERLTGTPVEAIEEDGAPHGAKHFVFWNPPVNPEGARVPAGSTSSALLEMLVKREARTLVFVRTRRQAEVVCLDVRRRLARNDAELAERVRPVPRLVPAGGAPRGGAGDAERRPDGRRGDQCAGTRHRHRRTGHDRPHRLPGERREHLAAGRTQRAHARRLVERARGARRPARPVPHAPPGLRLRSFARARADTAR